MDIARDQRRRAWVAQTLGLDAFELSSASEDASFRSYWRVEAGGRTHILMDAPPDRESIAEWLDIATRLVDAGLHAPTIVAADQSAGFVLMEDLGDRTYLPALDESSVDVLYADALDALLRLQTSASVEGLPEYDRARLLAEMRLMPEWLLHRHLGFAPDTAQAEVIDMAFDFLADAALEQPRTFVHRDFHSRNLLVLDSGNPGIIDFQDAVVGPLAYDLVSLLRDCYIAWDSARVAGWVEGYRLRAAAAHLIGPDVDSTRFMRWFDLIGLQRHIKVLGIFCRLWYRDGKVRYLADLPLVWRYTMDVAHRYPELTAFAYLLEHAMGQREISEPALPAT